MSLQITTEKTLPEHAVKLSYEEAQKRQLHLINRWPDGKDVWAFKYFPLFIGGTTALTAILMNNHFRYKCRLLNNARFSTYLPIVSLPTVSATFFHQKYVMLDVLMKEKCKLCLTVKSASIQFLIGFLFPLVAAPMGVYSFASRFHTIDIPTIKQRAQLIALLKKQLYPFRRVLLGLAILNLLVPTFIVYFEDLNLANVDMAIAEMEKKYQQAPNEQF